MFFIVIKNCTNGIEIFSVRPIVSVENSLIELRILSNMVLIEFTAVIISAGFSKSILKKHS